MPPIAIPDFATGLFYPYGRQVLPNLVWVWANVPHGEAASPAVAVVKRLFRAPAAAVVKRLFRAPWGTVERLLCGEGY